MEQLSKIVARQDADFKLSPCTSNETSINLSNDISNFISDESGEVSFRIYKDDLVKALSTLCLIPKVYMKKDTEPSKLYNILQDLYQQISVQFGESISTIYTINILKRDDGRAYFNNLKKTNGFNFRSFLVEQFSEIIFKKNDDGSLEMRLNTLLPEESVERKPVDSSISFDLDQPLQLIYYGAPGTGKSFTIDRVTNEKNSVRITFHPDSDYASFVGAYKPTMESVPMSAFVGKEVHIAQPQGEHTGKERKIVYKYVPQAFLKAYVEAWKRYSASEDNPYYLVIEEINRGNCAQIFGDLFQLLDRNNLGCSSYTISADEDIAQFLREDEKGFGKLTEEQAKAIRNFVLEKDSGTEEHVGEAILNGSKLLLPPNLRIWATMNTSDQSLFPIDSAFKRRWNWEYIPIEYDKEEWYIRIGKTLYLWGDFLEVINPIILEITGSVDKQMGYYFTKPDTLDCDGKKNIISDKFFVNKVLFYLWSDVLKDYDLTTKPFTYEDENHRKISFKFIDFFPVDGNDKLELFVEGLELDSYIDEPDGRDGNNSSLSVKWPDGEIMNDGKKYEVYVNALKKIGLQVAMENLVNRKRLGVPLISRTKDERIESHKQYRYVDEDGYYIIIGIDNYGSTLRYLSDNLGLGLEVEGE